VASIAVAGLSALGPPARAADAPSSEDLRAALETVHARCVDGQLLRADVLREFYATIGFEPVWGSDAAGVARATLALQALAGARDHGLSSSHYGASVLQRRSRPATAAALERELLPDRRAPSLRGRCQGRSAPPGCGPAGLGIPAPPREGPIRELAEAIESGTLAAWLDGLPPPHEGYVRLVTALRALHAAADQARVGPRTGPAPTDPRIRQVAVNLERWRWLPRSVEPRHLAVNAADASLVVVEDGRVRLTSRVIVGDELHPTPVVRAEIGALVLNSPWTVPTSIVVDEFLPKLRANPRFLADNDIAILDRGQDPHGLAIDWTTVSAERFPFRLQQRPGGGNPLGRIRFASPNRFDVLPGLRLRPRGRRPRPALVTHLELALSRGRDRPFTRATRPLR
jgi:murein L,D-transpeptidase YcbB/YkuD